MVRVAVWALYDLANTFFAVAMLSFYFPLWVVEDQGAKELVFSGVLAASMACVAVLMPICGAISDARGQRIRFLRWTTIGCVAVTALTGLTHHLGVALVLFAMANICYQLGTIFYDALLWRIAKPTHVGYVSGIGAAFGYLGSMAGLLFLWPFVQRGGHHAAFLPSAGFFLLFALPSLLLIREAAPPRSVNWSRAIHEGLQRLRATARQAKRYTGIGRFLLALFVSSNAINTVLVFMVVYTKTVLGFTEEQLVRFFLWGQAFAVLGSLLGGPLVRRIGAKRTLTWIWAGWIGALALVLGIRHANGIWISGPLIGLCLGPTWATSRVLLIQLAPKDQLAEFLGLAGLLGRAASIVGPLLWGVIVWEPLRYHHAIGALMVLLGIGLWIFRKVPEPSA